MKLRLYGKLLVSFIAVAMIAGSVGGLGINYIRTVSNDYFNVVYNYGFVQQSISLAAMQVKECNVMILHHGLDEPTYNALKQSLANMEAEILPTIPEGATEELEMMEHLSEHCREYFAIIEQSYADKYLTAEEKEEIETCGEEVIEHCLALMEQKHTDGLDEMSEILRINKITYIIFVVMLLTGFGLSIGIGHTMTKQIVLPLTDIKDAAVKLSKGDFDFSISHKGKDEIRDLSEAFELMGNITRFLINDIDQQLDQMANGNFTVTSQEEKAYVGDYQNILTALKHIRQQLNDTLNSIGHAVTEVNLAASQVSSGAQVLSDGATRQASSVEEISASMFELSGHVENIAQSANEANGLVGKSKDLITDSNEYMAHLVKAMEEIEDKSAKISEIAKTIEDIAFQTNILALNAAIEAARAGQAGKGFSVVADEVRSLAAKSAEAAKTTTMLIDEAIAAIHGGADMTHKTAESLGSVVEQASLVGEIVSQISNACEEQSMATKQLTAAIEEVSGVIQTNSATSEESAAASVELSSQAVAVSHMIEQFKLRK